jgi:type IV pilus assembly protein PilM
MLLRNPFSQAFGLNIGDLSIKLVQLKPAAFYRSHTYIISEARSTVLPPGLIVNGEIQELESVKEKILHLLGKEGNGFPLIKSPWVVASLPETKTFLKLIDVENTSETVSSVDVTYQAKKHLPYEVEDTYLDWQMITPDVLETRNQVLIGAVPKIVSDTYTSLLESTGLHPIALETEAVSIARAMITADKDYTGQARAILDLGATRSNLIVYDNNSVQFSSSLNFSGEMVTLAIAQAMKLDHAQAEQMKKEHGIKYDVRHPKYLPAVYSIVEKLIKELKTALLFYREHFNDINSISGITLCGGAANLQYIDAFISKELKISTVLGHPWKNLNNKKLYDYEPTASLSMTSAIGLALKAAQNPFQDTH